MALEMGGFGRYVLARLSGNDKRAGLDSLLLGRDFTTVKWRERNNE